MGVVILLPAFQKYPKWTAGVSRIDLLWVSGYACVRVKGDRILIDFSSKKFPLQ